MGLFGNLFGQKPQYANADPNAQMDPGMAMPQMQQQPQPSGLFGQQAQQQLQQPMSQMVQQPPAQHGGGFFAKDGIGQTIGGALSDWLLQANGMKPVVGPANDARDELQKALQLQAAKTQAALQEHRSNHDYDISYQAPTEIQQQADYFKSIGRPDLAESLLVNKATAPPLVQKNADGTSTLYPQGSIPRGISSTGGTVPHVTDAASYAAVLPGATYQTPDGHTRQKPGGAASNGGSTFQW